MGVLAHEGVRVTVREIARPYFERQMARGDRAIFQWTPGKRWPPESCRYDTHPDRGVCVTIHRMEPYYEGVHFTSLDAAARFDLERTCNGECGDPFCEANGWDAFTSWEDAERWLRGETVAEVVHVQQAGTASGGIAERPQADK